MNEEDATSENQNEKAQELKTNRLFSLGFLGCLGIIVCAAIIAFGFTFNGFLKGLEISKEARDSESWPTTEGTIVSSKTSSYITKKSSAKDTRQRRTVYRADVTYEYTVDAKSYSSMRISFGDYGGSKEHAEEIVKAYPNHMRRKS